MFLNEDECNAMEDIQDRRDELIKEINKYYDDVNGWYGRCLSNPGTTQEGYNCSDGVTRPLVYLNTILKRLKRNFDAIDIKPIYGIGTAKIPIAWAEPPNGDYWDTFTCLSFNPDANAGELFNVTQILEGNCVDCPLELVQEIECHRGLLELVLELVLLLKPLMTEEQYNDAECNRHCCDSTDPNYIIDCISSCDTNSTSMDKSDLFWDATGANAGEGAKNFCEQYENSVCVPLYITWKDGAHWAGGGIQR